MTENSDTDSPSWLKFGVTTGHLITIAITMTTAIWAVAAIRSDAAVAISDIKGDLRVQTTRLEQTITEFSRYRTEIASYNSDIRGVVTQLTAGVADLKADVRVLINNKDVRK